MAVDKTPSFFTRIKTRSRKLWSLVNKNFCFKDKYEIYNERFLNTQYREKNQEEQEKI